MTELSLAQGGASSARRLLKAAVHRSSPVSVDGLLERLFTMAFGGLVYPQIWEDPVVDLDAMEIAPHHHVVAIGSGGCNVLSYLAAGPARITAVDLNHAHVALCRLKIAGLQSLPSWERFYRFFGEADQRENIDDYRSFIRPALDAATRRYWDRRGIDGRRRISLFRRNIYAHGLLGSCIRAGHLVGRVYGRDLTAMLACRSPAEQAGFFDREIAPLFDKRAVRWILRRRASLFGLGIPPAQYEALCAGGDMAAVLKHRLRRLAVDFPLSDNYFAWQAFGRAYAPGASGPLPPYLQRQNFAALRARAPRLDIRHASLSDTLARMPGGAVHRFVLLDAQDWMTDTQLDALWRAITAAAAPDARVIFRTAGTETILPGRVDDAVLRRWTYVGERSRTLAQRDRSSIYGGFHIYDRIGGDGP